MRITPIIPTYRAVNPPRHAIMVIHHEKHTVVVNSGERFDLPAKEAWTLLQEINGGKIV